MAVEGMDSQVDMIMVVAEVVWISRNRFDDHCFKLWEETNQSTQRKPKQTQESMQTPHKKETRFEIRTFLLWGDGANHCTTMLLKTKKKKPSRNVFIYSAVTGYLIKIFFRFEIKLCQCRVNVQLSQIYIRCKACSAYSILGEQ